MSLSPRLTEVATLKKILGEVDAKPTRSAGQNFLICEEVVEATIAALDKQVPFVTELGAGLGVLTQALVSENWQVKAIERDQKLLSLLPKSVQAKQRKNLTVIAGDLREKEWTWPENYQLVGNIPYNLSGLIIRRLTSSEPAPSRVVLLVQKEVGERLTAGPACPSLLTLAVQLWGQATKLMNVPRNCFWPQPDVDSSLVMMTPSKQLEVAEREKILSFARPAYRHQRKQIQVTLRDRYNLSHPEVHQILRSLGLKESVRPAELTRQDWQKIAQHFQEKVY